MSERAVSTMQPFTVQSAADAKTQLDAMIAQHQRATPAAAKLSGMLGDAAFLRTIEHGGQHGSSDGHGLPGGSSFDRLQEAVTGARAEAGDPISRALAGQLADINSSGDLQMKLTVDALRGMGMGDDVIRQVLTGEPVSRDEHDRVRRWKNEVMTGAQHEAFRKAYLAGEPNAVSQMNHAAIVLSSPVKEEAAS
ncbi:hypothetical protein ACFQZO_23530 [Bradyrhizobium sp. GCM10027634]|uniref:hypothetical protein n=1 Tax=unclassified Bradyrhizobium TaxID=2631580 RepID=UPI00263B1B22|nr:hypothetical protein [Bradyrhizobium sp. WYCCWR 12677]MDN5003812.1 hypothetical protein [Bradyrhizobium sp. WYCCWR 12677]